MVNIVDPENYDTADLASALQRTTTPYIIVIYHKTMKNFIKTETGTKHFVLLETQQTV